MRIKCNLSELEETGVYIFRNIVNNKCYIGSTIMSFNIRMNHHLFKLNDNSHKNSHFQYAWNKYGSDNFEFDILEKCDSKYCLEREQYYLDTLLFANEYIKGNCDKFLSLGYNINPLASGTPNMSKETIAKRTKTRMKYANEASRYYQEFKENKIDFEEIPDKYQSMVYHWHNNIPWNKGKTYESTEHLKKPKKITDKTIQRLKNNSERLRNNNPSILVYDVNMNFLGKWRSSKDLEEWSLTDKNKLPIKSRFKGEERMGVPVKCLQSVNINKVCKSGKTYKNLYFKYEEPAQEVILDVELGKNGEF